METALGRVSVSSLVSAAVEADKSVAIASSPWWATDMGVLSEQVVAAVLTRQLHSTWTRLLILQSMHAGICQHAACKGPEPLPAVCKAVAF